MINSSPEKLMLFVSRIIKTAQNKHENKTTKIFTFVMEEIKRNLGIT